MIVFLKGPQAVGKGEIKHQKVNAVQGMDMPGDVVIAAHRGPQKSMGSHRSGFTVNWVVRSVFRQHPGPWHCQTMSAALAPST